MSPGQPRTFYRLVKHDPPVLEDFQPHSARRPPPWRNPTPEQLVSWNAVSTFVTEDAARAQERAVRETGRSLGDFIAKLLLPEGAPVVIGSVNAKGHCDLVADAQVLLDAVELPVAKVDG